MEPSKWESLSGKVHHRRLRFYIGRGEKAADPAYVVTLCGQRMRSVGSQYLLQVPDDKPVTCKMCLKTERSKAHLPR